jgi:hypothetical protein
MSEYLNQQKLKHIRKGRKANLKIKKEKKNKRNGPMGSCLGKRRFRKDFEACDELAEGDLQNEIDRDFNLGNDEEARPNFDETGSSS